MPALQARQYLRINTPGTAPPFRRCILRSLPGGALPFLRHKILCIAASLTALAATICGPSLAENYRFGPTTHVGQYELEALMEPADIPEYKKEHTGPYNLGTDGNPKDPRFLFAYLDSKEPILKHEYNKELIEEIQLKEVALDDFEFMTALPHLKEILILATEPKHLNQKLLNALATNKSLRHVQLLGDISQLDISVLKDLPKLSTLYLMYSHLTKANIGQIAKIQSLRWLRLENPDLPKNQFGELRQLKSLQELRLTRFYSQDADFSFLRDLPNLRRLYLSQMPGTNPDPAAINQIAAATNLEVLSYCLFDADLPKLRSLTNLRALQSLPLVNGNAQGTIHGETLSTLNNPHLQYLSLNACPLTQEGFRQLIAIRSLKGLDLSWTPIGETNITALSALTSLRRLAIDCVGCSTPTAPAKLSESLPNCSIEYSTNCHGY
jgi:hypothetical protein